MLGFRYGIDVLTTHNVVSAYLYNLSVDTYFNLHITNISSSFAPNQNGVPTSFKVNVNSGSYNINFTSQNLNFEEFIYYNNPNIPLTNISVVITDAWGYSLHSHGSRLVFTLAVE
jgi:hypothetical protein